MPSNDYPVGAITARGEETISPQELMDTDALLQASRRLDWRFLLPNPALEDVAYIGEARGTLLSSLRLFSRSLTMIEPESLLSTPLQYDVVVLAAPSLTVLRRADRLVKPGGQLYAEIYRVLRRKRIAPLRPPGRYAPVLRQSGFTEIRLHWHWPNFDACTKIIPLDDAAAFSYLLAQGRTDALAQAKATIGCRLLQSGLLGWGIPCFSLVARRDAR